MTETAARILSVRQPSVYFGVLKSTLYRFTREGEVPCQKIGRHWRFRKEAIDRWLEDLPAASLAAQAGGKGAIPARIVSWLKQSEEMRKIIRDELSSGRAREENSQLETRNQELVTRAKARWYVPDANKAGDLEKLREQALLREFEEYRESKQKRLKVFRLEAVRAGFKKAWQERDYATIIAVARKIPEHVLQEDPKLLMCYDQALTRMGADV